MNELYTEVTAERVNEIYIKKQINRLNTTEKRKNENVNRVPLSFEARKIMNFKCHIIKLY